MIFPTDIFVGEDFVRVEYDEPQVFAFSPEETGCDEELRLTTRKVTYRMSTAAWTVAEDLRSEVRVRVPKVLTYAGEEDIASPLFGAFLLDLGLVGAAATAVILLAWWCR